MKNRRVVAFGKESSSRMLIIGKISIIYRKKGIRKEKCFIFAVKTKVLLSKHAIMKKYECNVCGYVYDPEVGDPESGIQPGTPFEALPEDWVCPLCGVGKEDFSPVEE